MDYTILISVLFTILIVIIVNQIMKNRFGIHEAAAWGARRRVKHLLAKGGAVNELDAYGCTPLHHALEREEPEMVQLLLDAGADASIADSSGRTPWLLFQAISPETLAESPNQWTQVRAMLRERIEPREKDMKDEAPYT